VPRVHLRPGTAGPDHPVGQGCPGSDPLRLARLANGNRLRGVGLFPCPMIESGRRSGVRHPRGRRRRLPGGRGGGQGKGPRRGPGFGRADPRRWRSPRSEIRDGAHGGDLLASGMLGTAETTLVIGLNYAPARPRLTASETCSCRAAAALLLIGAGDGCRRSCAAALAIHRANRGAGHRRRLDQRIRLRVKIRRSPG